MSSDSLTPLSHAVLVLVGEGGAGAHDLVQMTRRGRVYWTASDSQLYAEPKRLARLGYLDAERRPGRTHERTHYTLTAKGREALRAWMREPAAFPRIQNEAVVRLLAVNLVGAPAVLASLRGLREDAEALLRQLDEGEAVAGQLPRREAVLRLNHRLARSLVEAHLAWLDEVEHELSQEPPAVP